MMKIVAIVMCMSVLVSSQEFMGDGFGSLMAFNLLSGNPAMSFNLFGGMGQVPPQQAQAAVPARQNANNAMAAQRGVRQSGGLMNPLGLLMFDVI